MNILITGGAGFIGSHLADKLIEEGHVVIAYDNLDRQVHTHGNWPDYLHKNVIKVFGDVNDYQCLKDTIIDNKIDVIYHFASKVGVGQSMYEIDSYVKSSVGGTAVLLDILVNTQYKLKKLIMASSMSCYGEGCYLNKDGKVIKEGFFRTEDQLKNKEWDFDCIPVPTDEDKKFESQSIYALSKKMQEEMCLSVGKTYDIPTVALRFWNIYGTRQSLSNPYTGVAAIFCGCYLSGQAPLIFEDGQQKRDVVHINDIVQACHLAMIKDEANYQSYNVGSGNSLSILHLAKTIQKEMNSTIEPIITSQYRVGDIRHSFPSIEKIKTELGYSPKYSFQDGVKDLIEWVKIQKTTINIDEMKTNLSVKNLIK